jgi:beta-glucanase (GH16 family)
MGEMLQPLRALASWRKPSFGALLAGALMLLAGCATASATNPALTSRSAALTSRSASRKSVVTPQPMGVRGHWRLVLNSTFNGSSLNTRVWRPDWFGDGRQITGSINPHELACYNSGNVRFPGDGAMNLSVTHVVSRCGGVTHPYTGAVVSTNPKDGRKGGGFQFTYGVLQAEIFVPGARGLISNWPALTTFGQHWPGTGEDDLVEGIDGTQCSRFHSALSPAAGFGGCDPGFIPGWHVVAADWSPNSITWYYDGVEIWHDHTGVTSAPMYIVLVNTVSERWKQLARPATVKVAYVRVWQPAGPRASHPEYKYAF